jgi:hypothetical protein
MRVKTGFLVALTVAAQLAGQSLSATGPNAGAPTASEISANSASEVLAAIGELRTLLREQAEQLESQRRQLEQQQTEIEELRRGSVPGRTAETPVAAQQHAAAYDAALLRAGAEGFRRTTPETRVAPEVQPNQSITVLSQNYDQTVSIELPTGGSILGRPAAEAVWLRPDMP